MNLHFPRCRNSRTQACSSGQLAWWSFSRSVRTRVVVCLRLRSCTRHTESQSDTQTYSPPDWARNGWLPRDQRERNLRIKETLSINALRARVYIYIRQLSSFRAPTLWFIDLTIATCHIQYNFPSLCPFFFSRENRENTKILGVRHETKMDAEGYWARKALLVRKLWVAVKVPTFF